MKIDGKSAFLAIMRDANKQHITLPFEIMQMLLTHLEINKQEYIEIGETLKADMRERYATTPAYGAINAILNDLNFEAKP